MLDLAQGAQIDGVVCSPQELDLVVERKSLLSITPGIRLSKSADDQSRVMTPKDAISKGADYIVMEDLSLMHQILVKHFKKFIIQYGRHEHTQ